MPDKGIQFHIQSYSLLPGRGNDRLLELVVSLSELFLTDHYRFIDVSREDTSLN